MYRGWYGQGPAQNGVTNMRLLMVARAHPAVPGNFQPRCKRVLVISSSVLIQHIRVRSFWGLFALLAFHGALAQGEDNRRVVKVVLDRDTVRLDSLSIVPGSFTLWADSIPVDPALYRLEPWTATVFRMPGAPTDTLIARYRRLPLLFAGPHSHKDRSRLLNAVPDRKDPFKYVPGSGSSDPLGISGLNKTGSISRGILFGNNQDLSVNSALNLELSGRLTDRISVLASVNDNNIPIQAGGNTAELQDFDRVFIKLFDERQELIAGDFVIERPQSHFLTYMKKTKGVGYRTLLGPSRTDSSGKTYAPGVLSLSAAISKGKFSRNLIQGQEGVQGPYRLTAQDGGLFIIVLSGTEQVFIDGQLLTRGQENDYVIDYNTAEITFTAKRLITKDRRIVVEFQFSDKNYARSLVRLSSAWTTGRTQFLADLYTEQDSKNQSLQQSLSDDDKRALSEAGDDPLAATTTGVDSTGYSADQVLYAERDSLGYAPVYVYSNDPEVALYRVVFSSVGNGNGDYKQDQFTPNGRVFRWVPPDTIGGAIVRGGDYAPLRVLVPPRSQQVAELGVIQQFSKRTRAWVRLAWSNDDRNTFSSRDDADNQGIAVRTGVEYAVPLSKADTSLKLVLGTDNEWLAQTFRPIERFRAVEFERNWNALLVPQDREQALLSATIGLEAGKRGKARLSSSTFQVRDRYSGYRQQLLTDLRLGAYDVAVDASVLTTSANAVVSDFLRHKGRVARRFKGITVGFRDEHERNRFRSDTSGSLINGSYEFFDWEAFVQSGDTARNSFRLGGGQRYEQALRGTSLAPSTEASAGSASFSMRTSAQHRSALTFTYRSLRILDTLLTAQRAEDTWLARAENDITLLKGALHWSIFYELGSGLEQRREFLYVQVPAGQGTYVWIDYNDNGIKELNEFEIANFGYEADYIRAYTQTNQYVRVFSNQLSSALELRPGAVWSEAKGIKRFLSKISDAASFRTDRKTGSDRLEDALDPFLLDPTDTALTAFSASLRNTVYFDRGSRRWSIDHSRQSDRNRSLLLNGFESRSRDADILHIRWNTTPKWTLEVEGEVGRSTSSSDLLSGRTYAIDQQATRPKITWQPNTSLRVSSVFKYTAKKNRAEFGGEEATSQDLGLEVRWNTAGKGSIQLNGNLVDILYSGETNSSLGNELLAGLKPGTNATWTLTIQRRLSNNLQIDLTYNGRQSEGTPTVHVGGAQVRAYF